MRIGLSFAALTLLGGASAIAASCFVPGFELVDGAGGSGAASGGSAQNGGNGGAGLCGSVRPPAPPSDATPGGTIGFVAAVRSVDFDEQLDMEEGPTVGYDLDKECTCSGGEPTCAPPGNAPVDCDGPGGRDNAVSRLFSQLTLFESQAFSSSYQSQRADEGAWSLLIRVIGYNGEPDDNDLQVAIYPSPGLDADPCLNQVPAWDGSDVWPVDAIALEPPMGQGGAGGMGGAGGGGPSCESAPGYDLDKPLYLSEVAYVSGGVLVAALPDASLVLSSSSSNTALDLVGGFLTATLESAPGGYALRNGVLGGRWRLADFFGVVGTIESNNLPICKNHTLYGPVKNIVCNYPDITAAAAGTQATPCDSLSFGMAFEAEPAELGIVVVGPPPNQTTCPPSEDPTGDNCDEP
jgi:opacity protein-like surface antigen